MTSVKHLRDNSARMAKLRKLGAYGSLKEADKGEHAPRRFVAGGAVSSGSIDGMPSKPRLDRPGRKAGKSSKGKKGGTNVNVIVMPKGGPDVGPMPPGAMAGPPSGPPMPMPPPGPGPGGPPMPPMRKHGGKVMSKVDDAAQDKKMAAAAMHKHEREMHGAKKLTKFRRGGKAGC